MTAQRGGMHEVAGVLHDDVSMRIFLDDKWIAAIDKILERSIRVLERHIPINELKEMKDGQSRPIS